MYIYSLITHSPPSKFDGSLFRSVLFCMCMVAGTKFIKPRKTASLATPLPKHCSSSEIVKIVYCVLFAFDNENVFFLIIHKTAS